VHLFCDSPGFPVFSAQIAADLATSDINAGWVPIFVTSVTVFHHTNIPVEMFVNPLIERVITAFWIIRRMF